MIEMIWMILMTTMINNWIKKRSKKKKIIIRMNQTHMKIKMPSAWHWKVKDLELLWDQLCQTQWVRQLKVTPISLELKHRLRINQMENTKNLMILMMKKMEEKKRVMKNQIMIHQQEKLMIKQMRWWQKWPRIKLIIKNKWPRLKNNKFWSIMSNIQALKQKITQ